jgi:gamma-glutamyltranspeptidase/glutathione hydrolase
MNRVDYLHTLIEAVKLAAVDRFTYMGDPAINGFPCDTLAHPEYGQARAAAMEATAATECEAGDPWLFLGKERPIDFPAPAGVSPDEGTTHITAVDADGNAVALTQTNLGFSGVVNPGVGVMMNNAMGWSCPMPGTVNSIAPFARALNNMTPMVLHREGRTVLALGASGGRRIWPAVVQVVLNRADFGMSLQDAMELPRIHVESDDPTVDPRFGEDVLDGLRKRGHRVALPGEEWVLWPFAEPNGIARDGNEWKSGLTPMAKPTHAAGF